MLIVLFGLGSPERGLTRNCNELLFSSLCVRGDALGSFLSIVCLPALLHHSFPIDCNWPSTDRDADARHNQHEIMLEPSPNVHLEKDDSYLPEVWVSSSLFFSGLLSTHPELMGIAWQAWYAIGVFIILLRFAVRIRTVGIRGFRGDDYLALPVSYWKNISPKTGLDIDTLQYLVLYSINVYVVQICYYTGANIDITPDAVPSLSDHDVAVLQLGSKLEFMSWYTYPGK